MTYVSIIFFAFCFLFLFIYYLVPKRYSKFVLLLANIIFVVALNFKFLFFILFTSISTFFAAKIIEQKEHQKKIMIMTILINILLLIFINYFKFGECLLNILFNASFNFSNKIIIPVGISFYTLQAVWYIKEVFEKKIIAEKNFITFFTFMSYFPLIVQGPISKFSSLGNQIRKRKEFDSKEFVLGFQLVLYGLFKKIVIANRVEILVNNVFNNNTKYSGLIVIIAVIFYSIQIYMDFSGAVDICRGVSKLFGIELVNNFNSPYFSSSIKEFWGRWHISLSTWLKENVYFALGGNRKGTFCKNINLVITFIVSGLWHGVGFQFIVWGLIHAFYQIIGNTTIKLRIKLLKLLRIKTNVLSYKLFKILFTFTLVSIAWIFFRAQNVNQAINIFFSIFYFNNNFLSTIYKLGLTSADFIIISSSLLLVINVSAFNTKIDLQKKLLDQNIIFQWIIYLLLIFIVIIFGIYGPGYNPSSFIYGNF